MSLGIAPVAIAGKFGVRRFRIADTAIPLSVPSNPNRVSLLFVPHHTSDYRCLPFPSIEPSEGFRVGFNGSPLIFLFRDVGPMVGLEWQIFDMGAGTTITVVEVDYDPKR